MKSLMKKMNVQLIYCFWVLFFGLAVFTASAGSVFAESMREHTAKLVQGAKKEGKLVWYTTMSSDDAQATLDSFNKKYPFIKTAMVRLGGARLVSRLEAEARAGKTLTDIIEHAGFWGEVFKRKGFFAKYIHPHWKYFDDGHKDPDGYWTSNYSNLIVIAYNTRMVSHREAPKTYQDLLDPKWKGRMGLVSNSESWFSFLLRNMGEEKGLNYFKKLAAQDLQLRSGATLNAQLVAAGELEVGIRLYNYRVQVLMDKGAPLKWIALEPIVAEIHPLGVTANAPHPNAARLFVDHVFSKEAQEMVANDFRRIPDRTDVDTAVPELKCRGKKIIPFDPSIVDDFKRYVKTYRKMILKRK